MLLASDVLNRTQDELPQPTELAVKQNTIRFKSHEIKIPILYKEAIASP